MQNLLPILALAPHSWNGHWLSRQHLLSRLGERGWPVLYSQGGLSLWDRHTPLWREAPLWGGVCRQDQVLVDQPGRLLPRWPRWPAWDRLAIARHAARLQGTLAPGQPYIAMLFHPRFWPYVEQLNPRYVVYHIYDVYSAMEEWSPELEAMQRALVARADLITTASMGMARTLPAPGPNKARVLFNGAEAERFATPHLQCPADLAAIPTPRIGYAGRINTKLDLAMVLQVAEARPDWQWVFIGPVMMNGTQPRDDEARQQWARCLTLPNIHHLPTKQREQVPAYLWHMDVNIICYRIRPDDWVVHGYPVKLHEYLATGKPVVAGAQEAVKELFSAVVAVAETPEEWLTALEQAIQGQGRATPAERRAVALANGWMSRVERLEAWLREMIQRP